MALCPRCWTCKSDNKSALFGSALSSPFTFTRKTFRPVEWELVAVKGKTFRSCTSLRTKSSHLSAIGLIERKQRSNDKLKIYFPGDYCKRQEYWITEYFDFALTSKRAGMREMKSFQGPNRLLSIFMRNVAVWAGDVLNILCENIFKLNWCFMNFRAFLRSKFSRRGRNIQSQSCLMP